MSKGKNHPTQEEAERLSDLMRQMRDRTLQSLREATAFKPGDLTPEEEELVKREGLNALNYIPKRVIQEQAEAFQNWERAGRPRTVKTLAEQWKDRFDGFGYGLFLFLVFAVTWIVIDTYDWPIGILSFLVMLTVLELSYQLYSRH